MSKDPSEIREDIENTRRRMGDAVEALTYKTDVKARVGEAVAEKRDAILHKKESSVAESNGGNGHLRDRSIPDLTRQLADETATLVRQEIDLAKVELTEKAKQVGMGAGMFGGAAIFAVLAAGALTACAIAAIAMAVQVWLAALIVGAGYLAIAGVLALMGKSRMQRGLPPKPDQTIETVKDDVEWAKAQASASK